VSATPAAIVADLARRGIRLEPRGDRLRIHPRSAMTPELVARLASRKAELLAWLRERSAIGEASPQRPAGRGYRESARPVNGPHIANTESVSVARPRQRFPGAIPTPPAGEWLAVWRRAPQTTPPPKPCGWCGSAVYWQHVVGLTFICPRCHPPAFPVLIAGWVQVVATEDGPQVVRIGEPPSKG